MKHKNYILNELHEIIDPTMLSSLMFRIIGLTLPSQSYARYKYIFRYLHYRRKIKPLLHTRIGVKNPILFSIVHLNAPDFLILALKSIRTLYPDVHLLVLDNGSRYTLLKSVLRLCRKYKCTLLYNTSMYKDHVLAIQYLIDYSISLGKRFTIILDNDVVLISPIDEILEIMQKKNLIIAGPHDLIKFNGKYFRYAPLAVHASLLILRPVDTITSAGKYCSFNYIITKYSRTPEPYHSLSYTCLGRILYLKPLMLKDLFPLTAYMFNDKIVGYHAWYSSRIRIHGKNNLDSLNIEFLKQQHKRIKEFLIDKIRSL